MAKTRAKIFRPPILFLVFFLQITAYAEHEPLIVGLGSWCHTATALRNCGLRKIAFPFDWLASPSHQHVVMLLDEDFLSLTDENVFIQIPYLDSPNSLTNTYYNIIFHHDTPFPYSLNNFESYKKHLEIIKIKYERRIGRFRELRQYEGKVFFIRNPTWEHGHPSRNVEEAMELKSALDRYFPTLDFTLVIVNAPYIELPRIEGLDGIIEYKTDDLETLFKALTQE